MIRRNEERKWLTLPGMKFTLFLYLPSLTGLEYMKYSEYIHESFLILYSSDNDETHSEGSDSWKGRRSRF